MAAITGLDGDVIKDGIQVCETTKWTFEATSNNPAYGSNCSGSRKRRAAGARDATGTLEGKWDPGRPVYGTGTGQFIEGSIVRLYLYINDNQYLDVPAVIDSFRWEVDMDTGDLVTWVANFSESDAWTANVAEESSNSSSSSSSSS